MKMRRKRFPIRKKEFKEEGVFAFMGSCIIIMLVIFIVSEVTDYLDNSALYKKISEEKGAIAESIDDTLNVLISKVSTDDSSLYDKPTPIIKTSIVPDVTKPIVPPPEINTTKSIDDEPLIIANDNPAPKSTLIATPMPTQITTDTNSLELAIVKKGKGIEQVLAKQLANNPDLILQNKFAIKSGESTKTWSSKIAGIICRKAGYTKNDGTEIRVKAPNKIAYKIASTANGIKIIELERNKTDGVFVETNSIDVSMDEHNEPSKQLASYEYLYSPSSA